MTKAKKSHRTHKNTDNDSSNSPEESRKLEKKVKNSYKDNDICMKSSNRSHDDYSKRKYRTSKSCSPKAKTSSKMQQIPKRTHDSLSDKRRKSAERQHRISPSRMQRESHRYENAMERTSSRWESPSERRRSRSRSRIRQRERSYSLQRERRRSLSRSRSRQRQLISSLHNNSHENLRSRHPNDISKDEKDVRRHSYREQPTNYRNHSDRSQ